MLTVLLFIMLLASTSNQYPIRLPRSISSYQLIHKIDSTTEMTGSITLCCRDSITADTIPLSAVHFWLNWTTINDLSLRERTDITVTESTCDNDDPGIQFNLTHHLDGYYTCGRRTETPVLESSQETLISLQTLIPMPDIIQNFTAMVGGRAVLPCPIQPGALLQHYSVMWKKDSIVVAEITKTQAIKKANNKYDINRSTYELIINPISANDSSTNYQCHVFAHNPNTGTKQELQYSPQSGTGVPLSLTVTCTKCAPLPSTAITTIVNNYSYTTMLYMCSNITKASTQAD